MSALAAGHPSGSESLDLAHRKAVWTGARRWSAALVVAAFPFLFILDGAVETNFSPVLPGLAVLCLFIVGLPPLVSEMARRAALRSPPATRAKRIANFQQHGRTALVVAFVWLATWLALGA